MYISLQTFTHYFLHFGFPFLLALLFFRTEWKKTYLLLLATMLIDLDHLLATPLFQENRCSIGFHPLHTHYAFFIYFILLFFPKPYKILGIGLLLHLLTDLIDCLFMFHQCQSCYEGTTAFGLLEFVGTALDF